MAVYMKTATEIADVYRVVISGKISTEVQKRDLPTGRTVTNFRLCFGVAKSKNPSDKGQPQSIRVTCWGEIADAAAMLDKGDRVTIFGKLSVNEYETKKSGVKAWEVEAEELFSPAYQKLAMDAYKLAKQALDTPRTATSLDKAPAAPSNGEDDYMYGYQDIDSSDIDGIFPDTDL